MVATWFERALLRRRLDSGAVILRAAVRRAGLGLTLDVDAPSVWFLVDSGRTHYQLASDSPFVPFLEPLDIAYGTMFVCIRRLPFREGRRRDERRDGAFRGSVRRVVLCR